MKRSGILVIILILIVTMSIIATKLLVNDRDTHAESREEDGIDGYYGEEVIEEEGNQTQEEKGIKIRIIDEEGEEVSELEIGRRYTLEIEKEGIRESKILLDDEIEIVERKEREDGLELKIEISPSERVRIKVDEEEREYRCKKRQREKEEKIYYLTQDKEKAYKEGYFDYLEIGGYEVEYNIEEFRVVGERIELIKGIERSEIKLTNEYEEIAVKVEVGRVEIEEVKVNLPKEIKEGESFKIEIGIEPSYASEQGYEIRYDERYIAKEGESYKGIKEGKSEIEIILGNGSKRYEIEIKGEEEKEEEKKINLTTPSNKEEEGIRYELEESRIKGQEGKIAQVRVNVEGYSGKITIESEDKANIYGSVIEIALEKSEVLRFKIVELDLWFEIEVVVE